MRRFKFLVAAVALMVLSAAVVPTASAQNTATWKAQFYNNLFLSGFNPAFETTYTNGLNVDWGAGSPDASIQADNFSARFSTDVFFNASTYRFSIRADDEFQLRINDNIVLSTMNAGQPSTVLTIDLNLSGATKLQVDYRERTGGRVDLADVGRSERGRTARANRDMARRILPEYVLGTASRRDPQRVQPDA